MVVIVLLLHNDSLYMYVVLSVKVRVVFLTIYMATHSL